MIFIKTFVQKRKEFLKTEIQKYNSPITLAIVQVGDNPASNSYIRGKLKDCEELGINGKHIKLQEDVSQQTLDNTIMYLGADDDIHGIIVQLPISKHLTFNNNLIPKNKDVDGFRNDSPFNPCTPLGISMFLKDKGVNVDGKNVVIIGRSEIVGKPMAKLMLEQNATVTICHSHTKDISLYTKTADIIIVAVGKQKFLTEEMIGNNKPIVIDVGINRNEEGKLCGDCDYENIIDLCEYVSPVPGGVGLVTRIMLAENTLSAYKLQHKK